MCRAFAALRSRRRSERTLRRQCLRWRQSLAGEQQLLRSWRQAEEGQREREQAREKVRNRFEAQWRTYARGLEGHIRAHCDQWVATLDAAGQPVWLQPKTGKTRQSNPVEARVSENVRRERQKAEERLNERFAQLDEEWQRQDAEEELAYLAGLEELAQGQRAHCLMTRLDHG